MDQATECRMNMMLHVKTCEKILFASWVTNTTTKFVFASIAIFILAVLYEGLKYLREKWFQEKMQAELTKTGKLSTTDKSLKSLMLNKHHLVQSAMHFLQVAVSYILMLIIMLANLYLCLAVVLGACCGYFLFGWIRQNAVDANEHCH